MNRNTIVVDMADYYGNLLDSGVVRDNPEVG